jgi:hypothetical protein
MADTDIERHLREAGGEFIEAHRSAEMAISDATAAGMRPDAIAHISGLSPETVAAFLRHLDTDPAGQ